MKTGKNYSQVHFLALCAALLVLCIVLAAGWSKAAKEQCRTAGGAKQRHCYPVEIQR